MLPAPASHIRARLLWGGDSPSHSAPWIRPQHDTAQLQAQAHDGAPEAQFQLAALHRKGGQGLKQDPKAGGHPIYT